MDEKHEQRAGEITVAVKLAGLDEQLAKAYELVETIEKARSLADDLAKGVNSIELERGRPQRERLGAAQVHRLDAGQP